MMDQLHPGIKFAVEDLFGFQRVWPSTSFGFVSVEKNQLKFDWVSIPVAYSKCIIDD